MQNTSEWLDDVFSDIRETCEDCEHPRCLGRIKSAKVQYADRIAAERAEAQIDVLQRLRGVMGKYKGDGVFDKKLFDLIGIEINNLRSAQSKPKEKEES